jgi:hypothetical protein
VILGVKGSNIAVDESEVEETKEPRILPQCDPIAAEALDLIEIGRVPLAGHRVWRLRSKLGAVAQRKGLEMSPFR